jgi:hypothetical protein
MLGQTLADLRQFARQFGGRPPQSGRSPEPDWLQAALSEPRSAGATGQLVVAETDRLLVEGPVQPAAPPQTLSTNGTDALAWYCPFHFYDERQWGIYIHAPGLHYLAAVLNGRALAASDELMLNWAQRLLIEHERWHFLSEVAATRAELVRRVAVYEAYFQDKKALRLEEKLANAAALRDGLRRAQPDVRRRAAKWMRSQPDGYREFDECLSPKAFLEKKREAGQLMTGPASIRVTENTLAQSIPLTLQLKPAPNLLPGPTEFLFPERRPWQIPIRIVGAPRWLRVAKLFPKYSNMRVEVHSNDHPPPHIHIKRPPEKEYTCYKWPEREPLQGFPRLSAKAQKEFEQYLERYGPQIDERVKRVFAVRGS